MFHLGMWRERFRNALKDLSEGREPAPPPENADEWNERELPNGIGTPLADAAARSDHLLAEIIELYDRVGERPMKWYAAKNTTEAVLRSSFTHPGLHLFAYLRENGDQEGANKIFEDAYTEMKSIDAPPLIMATVTYNLACARARQGRTDEALGLLGDVLPGRSDMKRAAAEDAALESLRDDPRFQALIKT